MDPVIVNNVHIVGELTKHKYPKKDITLALEMNNKVICIAIMGLITMCFIQSIEFSNKDFISQSVNEENTLPAKNVNYYSQHYPIRINSDKEFDNLFPGRVISGFEIYGETLGYCIFIGNCSKPFTVKDCYLTDASGKKGDMYCRDTGLFLYKSHNGQIYNNNCSENNGTGIHVYYSDNNTLTNNICWKNRINGIYLWASYYSRLEGNTCKDCLSSGIYLDSACESIIANSTCTKNDYGINLFQHSDNNKLIDNICSYNSCGIAIGESSKNTIIINNNCSFNSNIGIGIARLYGNTLKNNICISNKYEGIRLYDCDNNIISDNICIGNQYGLRLEFSVSNTITRNNFSYNYEGICLNALSCRNTLTNNIISENQKYGLNITQDSNVNRINHNNFINNNGAGMVYNSSHIQAYDNTGINLWNTSSEGNYWSDWTTPDNNSDGIVDYPYLIDGGRNASDSFPLTTRIIVRETRILLLFSVWFILGVGIIINRHRKVV